GAARRRPREPRRPRAWPPRSAGRAGRRSRDVRVASTATGPQPPACPRGPPGPGRGTGGRAYDSSASGLNLYPTPRTVTMSSGAASSRSIRLRRRRMCTSTVRGSTSTSWPHTRSSICKRTNTRGSIGTENFSSAQSRSKRFTAPLSPQTAEVTRVVRGRLRQVFAVRPPQHRLPPSHHLTRTQRLRDVVVGAHLETDHGIDLRGPGGEHDDGDRVGGLGAAQPPAHLEAVGARQHDI